MGSNMPRQKKTDRVTWDSLERADQLRTLRLICGKKADSIKAQYSDVLAVGIGYKRVKGEVVNRLALALLVGKKISTASRPIPSVIKLKLNDGGQKRTFLIPTDVEELGDGAPQAAVNVAEGIRAQSPVDPKAVVPGAACCVVEQTNDRRNRYVLSCHHVLALSLLTQSCNAANSVLKDITGSKIIGQLFSYLPMSATGQPCLDAALAIIEPGDAVIWEKNLVTPSAVDPGFQQPQGCSVYTPDGAIPARFIKEWANIPLPYPRCGTVTIRAVYQFQAATKPGHSGSPVMDANGTLHGMHFWGSPTRGDAYAIPAFVLFQPRLFPIDFTLP